MNPAPGTRRADPVLVTGAGGFIGRHLVAALCNEGRAVRAVVRTAQAASEVKALGADVLIGDLTDPSTIERATYGVAAVFHLAGRLFAPGVPVRDYRRLHVDATAALLEGCREGEALDFFVLCSTTGVHGPTGGAPAREDDPGHPQNAYEETKAAAETVARDLAQRRRVRLLIARPGLVYGPGERHLLGWFRSIRDGYYRVIGPGTNHLHPVYIDDVVSGLLLCGSDRATAGRAYHLVGSRPITMRDLSDAIGSAVGRPVPRAHVAAPLAYTVGAALEALPVPRRLLPLTRSRVRFMLQNREYDGTRARDELGFAPKIELEEGLALTVSWYRQHGWL
jgi:dihydroflavonol-4-reductase